MQDLRISRRQVLQAVGAVGALGALGVPTAVFADEGDKGEETRVRWDLVSIDFVKGTISAGGRASAIAQDGSALTLTGSGTFEPGDPDDVTGGGTWTATGSVTGSGTYEVELLLSFISAPGAFPPLKDLIGDPADATAGLAFLQIGFSNEQRGVLTVSCALPGPPAAPPSIFEGIRVSMGYVDFWNGTAPVPGVDANRTVFHFLRGQE
jgi:hypothetical protein